MTTDGAIKRMRKGRVTKAEWLSTALNELERGGIEAVRVEQLAKILSVAKSGFYWHFKDRRDLHRHLLDYWFHEYTQVVTSNPQLLLGEPKVRLEKVMKMVQEHDLGRYDLAIRSWAKHDDMAQEIVQLVTKTRLDFLRQIFSDMGFEGDELEMRTMLFVCYHSWERTIFDHMSPRKLTRLRKRRLELLSKP
jgi:AcrR family transcriptional regulator